jgi:predicted ATPase/DNA-binding winged helix-turn-helix (wHTH) protein
MEQAMRTAPTQGKGLVYGWGEWEVDVRRRELRARGVVVPIGGRAFEIIEVLVRSAGELVTKDELMAGVWPGAIVEESTLHVHISAIRKALGPDRGMLKTASGRGYRLTGNWAVRQTTVPVDPIDPEPPRPFRNNLPGTACELIGRDAALGYLRDLLSAHRVVTLTGPGGIGKTALALEVARGLLPNFPGDVWFVELASVSHPERVPSVVAGVIGLTLGGGEISSETVARAVGEGPQLLILDNCEHVIDGVAQSAETLVRLCPGTSILATSREILRIDGEFIYRVPPLAVPPPQEHDANVALEHGAVQLFIARITALNADFSPTRENLAAVAAICRRLDGIPLAIEFAAARAAALGVRQVAARLDDRFGLLTGGRRTALPRQQTLRATLDWSYELLPEEERRLMRRCAIFSTGFTLEGASAVMSDTGAAVSGVLDGIANLVAKSLLVTDGSGPSGRWRLLETIRAYALEKLTESRESEQASRLHARFFRDLVAPARPDLPSQITVEDMARYGREIDDVRAALDWTCSPLGEPATGIVLTAAYAPVWIHLGLMTECRERVQRALDNLDQEPNLSARLRMQLQLALGFALIYTAGRAERTEKVLTEALEVAERVDDVDLQLRMLWAMYLYSVHNGQQRAAYFYTERFLRLARRKGDPADILVGDRLMGNVLQYAGRLPEARQHLRRVLEDYVAPTDLTWTIWQVYDPLVQARSFLARVLWLQGFADQAMHNARANLEHAQALDHKMSICYALGIAMCPIALMTGDLVAAERSVTMIISVSTRYSLTHWKTLGQCREGQLLIRRGDFAAGLATLRAALHAFEGTGFTMRTPQFFGDLAVALAGIGKLAEALAMVEEGLARTDRDQELWCLPELLRIKGELLEQRGDDGSAAVCFLEALALARQQGALFWELRGALGLARLRLKQHRPDDARKLLAPIYEQFTEGYETADLRSARAVLDSLPPHAPGLAREQPHSGA